jgi:nitrogen fixation protein NifU and related proteins
LNAAGWLHCSLGAAFGILAAMFSEALLDHFRNPRNAGELPGATVVVEVSNPVCGDVLKLSAKVVDGRFAELRFLCRGCTTSIACASLLTEKISGRSAAEARSLTPETLSTALGGLPPATFHGAQLAIDGLKALVEKSR